MHRGRPAPLHNHLTPMLFVGHFLFVSTYNGLLYICTRIAAPNANHSIHHIPSVLFFVCVYAGRRIMRVYHKHD